MGTLSRNARSFNALNKALGLGNVFRVLKFDFGVEDNAAISFEKVLVLSPHPDDEAFGMGGTVKKMTVAGKHVAVAFLTDGSRGIPERNAQGTIIENIKPDKKLIKARKDEGLRSCEILGVQQSIFWGNRDSKLAASISAIKALEDLIRQLKPGIIFVPSFLDPHSDHRAANEILINAAVGLSSVERNFEIWSYEIWTPIFANRVVDISLYIKTKEEAIKVYASQLESRRYDKAFLGLSQYRAEIRNIHGYAEGFFASSFKIYKELYEKS
ncbi:MAG: PIG-L family deacetylase [Patescibacteria group bacterium]|jgi:LmbE family N-acetylglucosaminyl deacetylase